MFQHLLQRSGVTTVARRTFFTPISNNTTTVLPTLKFQQFHQQQQCQPQIFQPLSFVPKPTFNMMPFNGQLKQQHELKFAEKVMEFMNRNKRKPKKANHGARPCSSVSRSKKKLRRHHYPK